MDKKEDFLTREELERNIQEFKNCHSQKDFEGKWVKNSEGVEGVLLDHHPCSAPEYSDNMIFIPKEDFM